MARIRSWSEMTVDEVRLLECATITPYRKTNDDSEKDEDDFYMEWLCAKPVDELRTMIRETDEKLSTYTEWDDDNAAANLLCQRIGFERVLLLKEL